MALKTSYTHKGFTAAEAYLRIEDLSHSRIRGQNVIVVCVYGNVPASVQDRPLTEVFVTADYDSTMTVAAAYIHLKTLPEFAGATDI